MNIFHYTGIPWISKLSSSFREMFKYSLLNNNIITLEIHEEYLNVNNYLSKIVDVLQTF